MNKEVDLSDLQKQLDDAARQDERIAHYVDEAIRRREEKGKPFAERVQKRDDTERTR